uniref:BHLH domain-containing protein n=1 Tax=Gouania willdenowi TaxID=441366 RepID=A0A8C5I1D0_GOUWI
MTRSPRTQALIEVKSRKKSLKPVVEKKRRDRINQSLAELRHLLLSSTSDPRLQNPKIEKAEILDLAVEYLQKWTDKRKLNCASGLGVPLFTVESAGFQQCVAQLISFMHKLTPSERASLIDRLKHHTECLRTDLSQKKTEVDALHRSNSKEESPRLQLCPSHSIFQPHSCSTPCNEYLSPPPSPWFSPPFSSYTTSSPFSSFACHFSFTPSLSPSSSSSSSNTSPFSFSPSLPHSNPSGLHGPQLTTERAPSNPNHREGSEAHASLPMWRPWFL